MRLRQAHAILGAAAALEAMTFDESADGFEFYPNDDNDDAFFAPKDDDHLGGFVEFNPPTTPKLTARSYSVELSPTSDGRAVAAALKYGFSDALVLMDQAFEVWVDPAGNPEFREGVAQAIAQAVADAVRDHEKSLKGADR